MMRFIVLDFSFTFFSSCHKIFLRAVGREASDPVKASETIEITSSSLSSSFFFLVFSNMETESEGVEVCVCVQW